MGEPKWFKQWAIDSEDGTVGDGERETHLLFKGKRIDLGRCCGHNPIVA
jgi:hypothetical protein